MAGGARPPTRRRSYHMGLVKGVQAVVARCELSWPRVQVTPVALALLLESSTLRPNPGSINIDRHDSHAGVQSARSQ